MYRAGGISAIAFVISYIIIIAFYAIGGALPAGAEAWLRHLAANTAAGWAILGLSVPTDILLVIVALALFQALKAVNRGAMLLGAGILGIFSVLGPFFIGALGVVVVFSSILMTVWALLPGFRLYRLGQP